MSTNNTPPSLAQVAEGYVVLPFGQEKFKEFVKTLLGSPQAVTGTHQGGFEVTLEDVRNLHQLLLQRITQQNDGHLINFVAEVVYSDKSTVELNSIQELLTYNEVRPIISTALHISWDFLVRFHDKEVPEKQRIQLSIEDSKGLRESNSFADRSFDFFPFPVPSRRFHLEGRISYRIEHTARTWGADIQAMLNNHIQSILKTKSKLKRSLESQGHFLLFSYCMVFFFATLGTSVMLIERHNSASIDGVINQLNTAYNLNYKVDLLARLIITREWDNYKSMQTGAFLVSFLLTFTFSTWLRLTIYQGEPGFLLLTREASKHKERTQQRMQRKWMSFWLGIFLSLVTGVSANFIYSYLLQ